MADLDKHAAASAQELVDEMNRHLYGDNTPGPKIGLAYYVGYMGNVTRRNIKLTWRLWFAMIGYRVRDAWLVLRGKADIE